MDRDGIKISVSRIYTNVNIELGSEWYEYKTFKPKWNSPEKYFLVDKIGRGKYSTVFKGLYDKKKEIAIKVLIPLDPKRYLREIKILLNLKGGSNIINLLDLIFDSFTNTYSYVFEWVDFMDWMSVYKTFDLNDAKIYCFKLLKALDYSHSKGVIHRDVKPANIAIDKKKRRLRLLDWGLADFYFPKQTYSSHVGTIMFKSPELLIGYPYYDYSLDLWSAGLTFAIMIFGKHIIKGADNDIEQLYNIAEVIGGGKILKYANSLQVVLEEPIIRQLEKYKKGTGFNQFIDNTNKDKATPEVLDLLKKMLIVDHRRRITAKQAMNHPLFSQIVQ